MAPWPGQRLKANRYELLALLRRGGAGAVWRGIDLREGREVALKALPLEGGGQSAMEREAEAALRVAHPHALAPTDTFVDAEHAWLAMELCAGSVADTLEEGGPYAPVEAIEALRGPLGALAAAHAAGVVHRDVKPSNLLVRGDGTVLLADFGIARMLADGRAQTRSAALLGSLPYMAPEQRRDARDVRPATDVYAAAATLATMLCGAPVGDLYMPGAGLRLHAARVPEALQEVILRAGVWAPEERTPDAASLLAALEALSIHGAGGSTPSRSPLDGDLRGQGRPLAEPGSAPPAGGRALPTRAALGPGGPDRGGVPRNAPRVPTWLDAPAPGEGGAGVSAEASVPRVAGGASPRRAAAVGAAGWAVATGVLALLAGAAAGVWVALRDDVRGVLVEEAEEVRRARELAAIPVCEDAPSGFVTLNHPRTSQDPAGAVEAGGGRIVELFDSHTKAVLYGSQLAGRFDVFQVHPEGRLDVMSSRVAGRMTMDGYNTTAAGDVDGDGLTDLIGVSPETSGVVIAWAGASDAFEVSHVQTVANVREVLSFDVDKDGRDDIVTLALNLGRPTVQWQRSLGRTLEPHRELRSGVDHIDAGRIAGSPSLVVMEGGGWLRLFQFGSVIGLTEGRDIARVVLEDVIGVRILGAEVVVWNDDVAVRYATDPSLGRVPCRLDLPGTEISDVGFLNEDSILDIVSVRSCSYCTSLYTVFLGRPSQDPQLAGSE